MDPAYLSNVALLSSFYEQKKNYFDVYLPFVIKALETQAICNLEEVITNLKTVFHFGIPVNVLKTIVNENEGKYFASHRKSSNWQIALSDTGKEFLSQIAADERQVATELSSLYQSIRTFCENIGVPSLNDNDLSQSINAFLSSNLGKFLDWKVPGAAVSNTSFDSMFVRYLFEIVFKDRAIENTIEKMWKGMVLLSTMSTNSGARREGAFTQTLEIFVDTNVIFSLLGLHNPIFSRGISELFQLMARVLQIKVYVYDETLHEFDRILDVYDMIKGSFYDIQVDTVFYFLKKQGYDSTKVLSLEGKHRRNIGGKRDRGTPY